LILAEINLVKAKSLFKFISENFYNASFMPVKFVLNFIPIKEASVFLFFKVIKEA